MTSHRGLIRIESNARNRFMIRGLVATSSAQNCHSTGLGLEFHVCFCKKKEKSKNEDTCWEDHFSTISNWGVFFQDMYVQADNVVEIRLPYMYVFSCILDLRKLRDHVLIRSGLPNRGSIYRTAFPIDDVPTVGQTLSRIAMHDV